MGSFSQGNALRRQAIGRRGEIKTEGIAMKKFFNGKRTKRFASLALSGALILCQGMSLLADTSMPASSAQLMREETAGEESADAENAAAESASLEGSIEAAGDEAALSAADGETTDGAAAEKKASDADLTTEETAGTPAGEESAQAEEESAQATEESGEKATDAGIPLVDDLTVAETQAGPIGVANTLSYEDGDAIFTISYGEDAGLPADTELTVETCGHDSPSYKDYYALADSTAKKLEENSAINFAEFYAVSLSYTDENGEEVTVKPEDFDYTVTVEYPDNSAAVADTDTVRGFSFRDKKATVLEASAERSDGSLHAVTAVVHGSDIFGVVSTETLDLHTLQFENDDLRISLDYTERSGIPDGAELLVEPIVSGDERYSDTRERITGELLGGIEYFQLYDISIRKDGEEIEPADKVTVKIVHKDDQTVSAGAEMQILHLGDDGTIDKLNAETNERAVLSPVRRLMSAFRRQDAATSANLDSGRADTASGISGKKKFSTISFRTDSFSLYAEVGVLTTTLETSGGSYTITATFGPEAEIPAGTQLVAKEILSGTEDYTSYLSRSEEQMADAGISAARFFDISFVRNGKEIEPKSRVGITITMKDGLAVPDGAEVKAVHFAKGNASAGAEEAEPETIAETISGLLSEAAGTVTEFLTGTGEAGTDGSSADGAGAAGIETPELLDVDVEADGGTVSEVSFIQDSFSVTGVVVTEKTEDGWPEKDGEYVVLLSYNNHSYAMKNDGSLLQVSVKDNTVDFGSTITQVDALKDYLWTWTAKDVTLSNGTDGDKVYIDPFAYDDHRCISRNAPKAPKKEESDWGWSASGLELDGEKLYRKRTYRSRLGDSEYDYYLAVDEESRSVTASGSDNGAASLSFVNQLRSDADQPSPNPDPGDQPSLDPPVAVKELVDKENGTYDLSLSITGMSKSSSESSKADVVVILDRSGSMTDNKINGETRLQAAKGAIEKLTDSLMANNTEQNPDAVRMALITFGNGANLTTFGNDANNWTNNAQTFTDTVNNLPEQTRVGTNWEAALRLANTIPTRTGAEKYIIFVSDGNPTFYVGGGTGEENTNNVNWSYRFARDDAYTLVKNGFNFYTIGVFGDVSRMQSLTAYAYSGTDNGSYPSGHYQTASDQTALVEAFKNIIDQITHNLGYQAVTFTDGLTAMTSSTLVNGKAAGFTYTVTDAGGKSVTVTDKGDGTFGYTNSAGAKKTFRGATYQDGTVTWSMDVDSSTPFVLDGGYTYKVTFTVWPKQEAYDLAAGLMNGTTLYDNLKDDQKAQISKNTDENGQTTYSLKTNTEGTNVKYRPVTETTSSSGSVETVVGKEGTANISNPSGISLAATQFTVEKRWKDDVDREYRPESITFDLVQDKGIENKETVVSAGTLSADNKWTTTVYIAPGLIVDRKKLENGHTYDIVEKNTDSHYELVTKTYHPMLIDSNTQIYDGESKTDSSPITQFVAENELKGSLSLEKRVLDTAGKDITTVEEGTSKKVNPAIQKETFDFAVKLVSPKERSDEDYQFAFYDQSKIGVENPTASASGLLNTSAKISGYTLSPSSDKSTTEVTFQVTLKPGERFDLPFVPLNTEYTITEKATNSNYTYDSAECSNGKPTTKDPSGNPIIKATVAADTKDSVVVKNKRDAVNLTVTKVVTGNVADKNKNFTFKLVIEEGEKAVSLTNEKALTEGTGGEYTFTLKDQESITIQVPKGVKYTVEEKDKGDYQLKVAATGNTNDGKATDTGYSATPTGDTSLTFTNTLDAPLTGVREHVNLAFVPVVLFALAGLFYFSRSRY